MSCTHVPRLLLEFSSVRTLAHQEERLDLFESKKLLIVNRLKWVIAGALSIVITGLRQLLDRLDQLDQLDQISVNLIPLDRS